MRYRATIMSRSYKNQMKLQTYYNETNVQKIDNTENIQIKKKLYIGNVTCQVN